MSGVVADASQEKTMNQFDCLATFVAVVEKGGFAAAARHLSIGGATVTRQVLTLEDRTGARLLHRTTRKCSLTEAGLAFYLRSKKIIEDLRDADAIAKEFHASTKGTIRVNTSATLISEVSAVVARYAANHEETSFDVITTDQMSDLLDDRIDLAIRDESITESSMIVRSLTFAEWTACASPGYISRHGMPNHPAELGKHNCLIYVRGNDCDRWRFTNHGDSKTVRVSGNLRSSDPRILRAAAIFDQGVVLLPDAMVAESLQAGHLVRVVCAFCAEGRQVRAVYPSRQLSLKVRTFLDFAAREFLATKKAARPSEASCVTARDDRRDSGTEPEYSPADSRSSVISFDAAKNYGQIAPPRHGEYDCLPKDGR
jgi:DNA-binding transcriptional LysR family regulator